MDVETESPIVGAEVRDFITGNSMRTNQGGAVGLLVPAFVKQTGAMIEVRMAGYQTSQRMFVDPTVAEPIVFALIKSDSPRLRPVVRKRTDSTVFRVEVLDDNGAPLADADVAIVRGVALALDSRVTDSAGVRFLGVPLVSGDVQLSVQKLGYAPYRQFYRLTVADTVVAQVAMRRLARQLGAITVVAKRRIYHLDENEIANSSRPLVDGLDVVRKLRPGMFGDRLAGMQGCGVAAYIYVNGRRIWDPPQAVDVRRLPPPRASSRSSRGGLPPRTTDPRGMRPATPTGEAAATEDVRRVLAGIKPEHIAEMTYLDCFDTSVPGLRSNNAIYVVLKFGIEYDERRGSVTGTDAPARNPETR
jgi:hypothetical protein